MTTEVFDLVIIGGGLVGASLALALQQTNLKIAIVESNDQALSNNKTLALSYASLQIFKTLDFWREIAAKTYPISQVEVSAKNHFGSVNFKAEELQIESLGFCIAAADLLNAMQAYVKKLNHVTWLAPAKFLNLQGSLVTIDYQNEKLILPTKLLIAADGAHSVVREQLGIAVKTLDHAQTAFVGRLRASHPKPIAYERFLADGVIALLPIDGEQFTFVRTVKQAQIEKFKNMPAAALTATLQADFGFRMGQLEILSEVVHYPLITRIAAQQAKDQVILLGNAAHSLHPIAAQGFNLSLRDAAMLAEVIVAEMAQASALNAVNIIKKYIDYRQADQKRIEAFTQFNLSVFAIDWPLMDVGRSLALFGLERFKPLKQRITKLTVGLLGFVPKLAQGIRLVD